MVAFRALGLVGENWTEDPAADADVDVGEAGPVLEHRPLGSNPLQSCGWAENILLVRFVSTLIWKKKNVSMAGGQFIKNGFFLLKSPSIWDIFIYLPDMELTAYYFYHSIKLNGKNEMYNVIMVHHYGVVAGMTPLAKHDTDLS